MKKTTFNNKRNLYVAISAALLFILTACGGGTTTTPTPVTLSISPAAFTTTVGSTITTPFTATFSDSSSAAAVTWTLSTADKGGIAPAAGASTTYTPPATGTAGAVVLTATGGGKTATATITVNADVTPSTGSIDTVKVQGYGTSTQVAQGTGLITVEITGTELADIGLAKLGDLTGTKISNGPTAAVFTFTVPDGAAFEKLALVLNTAGGQLTKADAIEITPVTAGPSGDDLSGKGTFDLPYKTMVKAISITSTTGGSVVFLQDGTYNTAGGESFPQDISGIELQGESQTGVIISGTGATGDGLSLSSGKAQIFTLTVTGFSGGEGIYAEGSSELEVTDTTWSNNKVGLALYDSSKVTVFNSTVSNSTEAGIYASASGATSKLTVADSTITSNGVTGTVPWAGIDISRLNELDVDNTTVSKNGAFGLDIGYNASVKLIKIRNSTIIDNTDDGVQISNTPDVIDLGRPTITGVITPEAGNNTIEDNGGFAIDDQRTASGVQIWANGNDLGGTGPDETGIKTGGSSQSRYNINVATNVINFGP